MIKGTMKAKKITLLDSNGIRHAFLDAVTAEDKEWLIVMTSDKKNMTAFQKDKIINISYTDYEVIL